MVSCSEACSPSDVSGFEDNEPPLTFTIGVIGSSSDVFSIYRSRNRHGIVPEMLVGAFQDFNCAVFYVCAVLWASKPPDLKVFDLDCDKLSEVWVDPVYSAFRAGGLCQRLGHRGT